MEKIFDISKPVTGELLIGRRKETADIQKKIFDAAESGESGLVALTGMNRIGKTSLMKNLCLEFRKKQHPDIYLIEASLQGYDGFWSFMICEVIRPLFKQIQIKEIVSLDVYYGEDIERYMDYYSKPEVLERLYADNSVENDTGKINLKELFRILHEVGKSIILIFDEFDCAPQIFGTRKENFAWLRNLLQASEGVSLVTLSRRSIYYIETNSFGGSTLHGIFDTYSLYGFKNSEISEYFLRLEQAGVVLTNRQKEDIVYYCGRSPYYLAVMGQAILEGALHTTDDIGTIFSMKGKNYYDSFDCIVELLDKEKTLNAMLQMFVGPVHDLQKSDVDRLIGMGYCMSQEGLDQRVDGEEYTDYMSRENDRAYLTVSDKFVDYLAEVKHKEVENIWPALSHTERLVRKIIECEARKKYGSLWEVAVNGEIDKTMPREDEKKRIERFYDDFMKRYKRLDEDEQKQVECCKLQVVNFGMLWKIMYADWKHYKKYFTETDTRKLEKEFRMLQAARNPLAHNNKELLTEKEIAEVSVICERICADAEKCLNVNRI
ncbi:MAG: ATP-binding protein [Lachnospiraceae bacterium]|nr:ATP-binding protein [Lachnospiraceae bacterium]MBO5291765.1 ATP-binding protein [Lachnospiraceae bacterium]